MLTKTAYELRMRYFILFALLLIPTPNWATDAPPLQAIRAALSEFQFERWTTSPDWVLEDVAAIGFSYGRGGLVTEDAVETSIAHTRAEARARAWSDLLKADLNGDLVVTRSEAAALELAYSGRNRARLWTRFAKADSNSDSTITPEELAIYAELRSMDALPESRAAERRAYLLLDADGDGAVTLDEASAGLAALAARGRAKAARFVEEDA